LNYTRIILVALI